MLPNGTLTYISLFSSAGVGCYGFKEVGFECIATNEKISRRLDIQKLNQKCRLDSGYIGGDIKDKSTKAKIFNEVDLYRRKFKNDRVDVVVATPPCQGMSVANHKKSEFEIERNSLIVESVEIIAKIKPRFFILENVSSFYKTGCVDKDGKLIEIGEMIEQNLSQEYSIYNNVINFKNYGANSSRTRTLVIGVCKGLKDYISGIELFPDFVKEKTLKEVIGTQQKLEWGEFDENDFYHSFRLYPAHMREWIKDLHEGETAFDNVDKQKRPHKVLNGQIVINASKNGDKYRRQKWNSVAPCIHTRNDQLASQNTIHPSDDRVFSIRELMLLMNIPASFKWLPYGIDELNSLNDTEKRVVLKKSEMNIRQSIGEAVPTIIFRQIAEKIFLFMKKKNLTNSEILRYVVDYDLTIPSNLKSFIEQHLSTFSNATLSNLAEMANAKRAQNNAYFTNKFIVNEIAKILPSFNSDSITIIEPSVGCGNFIPIIFKKYEHIKKVNLKLIDIDKNSLDISKILYEKEAPKNFHLDFICADFMDFESNQKIDLIVGNPPFSKIGKSTSLSRLAYGDGSTNLAGLFLEKSLMLAEHISMIMPKNLLSTQEYHSTRQKLQNKGVSHIVDFGEFGFRGVLIETINITTGKTKRVSVKSLPLKTTLSQPKDYIFDTKLPHWVIYRDRFFDDIFASMSFDIFDSFRDRQLTNSNTTDRKDDQGIRVLKSCNIDNFGNIVEGEKPSYVAKQTLQKLKIREFLDRDDVYLTPNMTYYPRIVKKEKDCVANGSVAILIPKQEICLTQEQKDYIASSEFRKFYRIARNYQTRTLNIDKTSCFWFGIQKKGAK